MRETIAKTVFSIYHPDVSRLVNDFRKTSFYSVDDISKYQNKKLSALVFEAYKNVPYYKSLFDSLGIKPFDITTVNDLSQLPLLTKDIIRSEKGNMINEKILKFSNKTTSGSTGHPITIRKSISSSTIEIALMNRFLNEIGYKYGDKELFIWGSPNFSQSEFIRNHIRYFLYNKYHFNPYKMDLISIDKLIKKIVKCPPKIIRGYTSAVVLIAKRMIYLNKFKNIDVLTVTAEQLLTDDRQILKKAFGNNIFDQYGSMEIGSLAFECKEHIGFHHAFEHSILEVIDANDSNANEGRVVLTDLDNYSMPLIRYENGDIISKFGNNCQCGRNSIFINKILGRTYDCIKGTNGTIAHGGIFDEILMESGIRKRDQIIQMRIIQIKLNEICVEYISPKELSQESKEIISKKYKLLLGGDIKVSYLKVVRIPPSPSGKIKFVISLEEYQKMQLIDSKS